MSKAPFELLASLETALSSIDPQKYPQQAAWNQIYFQQHRNRYASDLRFIQRLYAGGDILEVGALPCHLTFCLHEAGLPYTSMDLNPSRAEYLIATHGLRVRSCDIEQETFPFTDAQFSFVIFNETFEHLRINPLHTLREIRRVLQPGGTLLLTTPNLYALGTIVRFLLGKGVGNPYKEFEKLETVGHMGHIREYTTREVREFLTKTGFTVTEVHKVHYPSSSSPKERLKKLIYSLAVPFRPYQVLVAKNNASY